MARNGSTQTRIQNSETHVSPTARRFTGMPWSRPQKTYGMLEMVLFLVLQKEILSCDNKSNEGEIIYILSLCSKTRDGNH